MWHRYIRAIALLLLSLAAGCASSAPAPALALAGALALRAPAAIAAGEPATLVAERIDAPDGLAVTLVTNGSYGARVYRGVFLAGRAEFRIPGADTQAAGFVTLRARAGAAAGDAKLTITPGPPVDPVVPLVGPRTIIADGAHWGTALAIPFDAYGNPVAEGTPVTFSLQRPGAQAETFSAPVTNMLAWRRVFSATRAGRTTITVSVGAARGPDASLIETPGWPAPFALSASPLGLPADGQQLVTLRTQPVVDAYGNPMLDGTLVTFVAEVPGGQLRFIPAYTIDAVAEAQIQAPTEPGAVTVRATLYGIESAPLQIVFAPGPAVGSIPVGAQVDAEGGAVVISAGPLLAALGQFAPEATAVQVTIIGPDGVARRLERLAAGGRARVELRLSDFAPGEYRVEVAAGSGAGRASFRVP
ncbi:MAG: hypothetical protein WCI67_15970 [Chloroflexales bacterium]